MHSVATRAVHSRKAALGGFERKASASDLKGERGAHLDVLRARNDERRQIARELHDITAQLLLELQFELACSDQQGGNWSGGSAREIVARLQDQMRCLTYMLHPPELEKYGLDGALEALALGMSARTGIDIRFKVRGYRDGFPPEMELAVLRIAQEALMNVFKHSRSDRAEIRLHCTCNWLCLRVRDFGVGIKNRKAIVSGLGVGLRGMAARMSEVGGEVRVPPLERGTAVTAVVRSPLGICNEMTCPKSCPGPSARWRFKAR